MAVRAPGDRQGYCDPGFKQERVRNISVFGAGPCAGRRSQQALWHPEWFLLPTASFTPTTVTHPVGSTRLPASTRDIRLSQRGAVSAGAPAFESKSKPVRTGTPHRCWAATAEWELRHTVAFPSQVQPSMTNSSQRKGRNVPLSKRGETSLLPKSRKQPAAN